MFYTHVRAKNIYNIPIIPSICIKYLLFVLINMIKNIIKDVIQMFKLF